MQVGTICTHKNHRDWGLGVITKVEDHDLTCCFIDVGRRRVDLAELSRATLKEERAAPDVLLDRDRWYELAVDLPASKATARNVTEDDLVFAIRRGHEKTGAYIVWAVEFVRAWFQSHHLLTGERSEDPHAPYNGPLWEAADQEACQARRLQKWKRENGRIGWSLRQHFKHAEHVATKVERIEKVDRAPDSWLYHRWDASTQKWLFYSTHAR